MYWNNEDKKRKEYWTQLKNLQKVILHAYRYGNSVVMVTGRGEKPEFLRRKDDDYPPNVMSKKNDRRSQGPSGLFSKSKRRQMKVLKSTKYLINLNKSSPLNNIVDFIEFLLIK